MPTEQPSLYEIVGGEPTFRRLVSGFYARVKEDNLIGPMYPQDDWEGAENRLLWFLTQYWGGPRTYQEERGHPRLRMRHMPFPIDPAAAQRWLEIMDAALAEVDEESIPPAQRQDMWSHFERVAYMMINRVE